MIAMIFWHSMITDPTFDHHIPSIYYLKTLIKLTSVHLKCTNLILITSYYPVYQIELPKVEHGDNDNKYPEMDDDDVYENPNAFMFTLNIEW